MAVDHDKAGHLERRASCGVPLSQSHGQAMEGTYEEYDYGTPSRHQGFRTDVACSQGPSLDVLTAPRSDEILYSRCIGGQNVEER